MKGIIFTQFLTMVEDTHGYAVVDEIIEQSDLPSKGVYTAVGTYSHDEMHQLVHQLSQKTGANPDDLYYAFGTYFFSVFEQHYEHFLKEQNNAFSFLDTLESYIHVEVKKLYPEAELPRFDTLHMDAEKMEMLYTSERKMGPFAKGLIERCLAYYGETATVSMTKLDESGSRVQFVLTK
jgi:hypothetical protein